MHHLNKELCTCCLMPLYGASNLVINYDLMVKNAYVNFTTIFLSNVDFIIQRMLFSECTVAARRV
jgi:hypothetical protein